MKVPEGEIVKDFVLRGSKLDPESRKPWYNFKQKCDSVRFGRSLRPPDRG